MPKVLDWVVFNVMVARALCFVFFVPWVERLDVLFCGERVRLVDAMRAVMLGVALRVESVF